MLNVKTLSVLSAIALIPVAGNAATVAIDSFTTTQGAIDPAGGGLGTTSTVSASEALGGTRTITANGTGGLFPLVTTTISVGGGTASVSNSDQVVGTGLFEWAMNGEDLTDGGTNDTFVLQVVSADLGGSFELTVDGLSSTSTYNPATSTVSFSFGAYGNLSSANAISLLVSGPTSFDTSFSFLGAEDLVPNTPVSPVPLPAAGLLLGSVLLGGGIVARRKAKS